jgi:hypothetical protein
MGSMLFAIGVLVVVGVAAWYLILASKKRKERK